MRAETHKGILSWLAVVSLAGSVLGVLEGLWQVWQAPPLSPTEAVLVLGWASLAYAGPALLLAGVWIGIVKAMSRPTEKLTGIPGALIPLGVWVGALSTSILWANGVLSKLLIELPASIALAVGLCLWLRTRWPSSLDSVRIWLLLHGLTLAVAALWAGSRYGTGGQMLVVVLAAGIAGVCCLWGFARPSIQGKALVGANGIAIAALILLAAWPPGHVEATAGSGKQRNVLLITVDTLRADHLGSYGYSKGQTPTMDRMAAEGVVFEETHSQSPFTCPSHASILTGQGPFQHGAFNNYGMRIRVDVLTLPEILSRRGYESAAFVSASVLKDAICGLGARFHTYGEDLSPWRWLPQMVEKVRGFRILTAVAQRFGFNFNRIQRSAAETTDAVLQWLERPPARPFFLWVHYYDPHVPFVPPPPYDRLFDPDYTGPADGRWYSLDTQARERISNATANLHHMIALYDGEVAYVDSQIRRLREALTRLGLEQNTLVILTADHGESHGEHNRYFARDLHRPSLHVPLILDFPEGEVQPRRVSDQVRLIDLAPTVLDYLRINEEAAFEGKSLLPLIRGDDDKGARPAFALFSPGHLRSNDGGMFSLQDKGYKLIWSSAWWYGDGVRVPPREELYDVQSDPQESEDILDQEPPTLLELRHRLTQWREQRMPVRREPTGELRTILKSLGYVQ